MLKRRYLPYPYNILQFYNLPHPKTTLFKKSYSYITPTLFSGLPESMKKAPNIKYFSKNLKKWLIENIK